MANCANSFPQWKTNQWQIVQPTINVTEEHPDDTICKNCGRGHTEDCQWPIYYKTCSNCLVTSIDGDEHNTPCNRINKITLIRSDILATKTYYLFDMEFSTEEVQAFLMDDGIFLDITEQTVVRSPPAESLLLFGNLENGKQCISLKQAKFRRCCIFFAL